MSPKKNSVLEGTISVNGKGVGYFRPKEEGEIEVVEVAHDDLNTALHGDKVRVAIEGKNKDGVCIGEVVEVLSRSKKGFAGKLETDHGMFFLVPQDSKMYADILIPHDKLNGAEPGQKVFVELTDWTDSKKSPLGAIIQVLGKPGDNDAEMHAFALEKGFAPNFPKEVEEEANAIRARGIKDEDHETRRDFRKILTFTIDPADAKDFDDALSYQKLPDGTHEVGIHIADVSHYVRPGSAIDNEAMKRATSVYLVDRVIPMLPEVLSNDLCSLVEGEDRLTFGAVFTLDDNANILSSWFGKTAIHSAKRFSYEDAQAILDAKSGQYFNELDIMNRLAKKMNKERFANGALTLETDEVKFKLDEKGVPISVYRKVRGDTHKMIEEWMLLANRGVAEYAAVKGEKDPNVFVYRVHDEPDRDKMMDLSNFLRSLGFKADLKDGIIPSTVINSILTQLEGKPEQGTVQTRVVRSMQKAIYTTKNIGHYGLAFQYYTHFTSPIRRYPDTMVHRLLQTYLEGGSIPKEKWGWYDHMCEHSSLREKEASDAERGSIKYKQVEYMSYRVGQEFTGVISGLTQWGMYVEEEETKCEGMVKLRDLGDDFYSFDDKTQTIKGERNGETFAIGDKLKIRVKTADLNLRIIDYVPVKEATQ